MGSGGASDVEMGSFGLGVPPFALCLRSLTGMEEGIRGEVEDDPSAF